MDLAIFTVGGYLMVLRWIHFLSGVLWIGLLYYFNFVQGAFMAEADAPAKSQVLQKLLPRALFWFRWAAMGTFLSGLLILAKLGAGAGVAIVVGSLLAIIMFLNVWLVIWPNQKVVIQNATDTAQGKPANPKAADCGARALMASRTNAMFSIPMLFFMGASTHLPISVNPEKGMGMALIISSIIIAVLELNAVKGKKLGPLTKISGFVHMGLLLTVILYLVLEFTTK